MAEGGERIERATWRALGTSVDVLVVDAPVRPAREAVEALLEDVDATCSTFRTDSELAELNRRAGEPVELSPLLADALAAALRGAVLTDGLCDPTVGRALHRLGYDGDFATALAASAPILLRLERVPGWRTVRLDLEHRTVRVPRGVALDLGATGKAFAADLAARAALEAMGGGGVLVNLGGDLAIGGSPPREGWRVLAAEDSSVPPDAGGEVVALWGGALATSSTIVRRWRRASIVVHHLIDPRTGLPAVSPWRTVSVIAGSCLDANAASTAALVLGTEGPAWLERVGLAGRFVGSDGSAVRVGTWPQPVASAA